MYLSLHDNSSFSTLYLCKTIYLDVLPAGTRIIQVKRSMQNAFITLQKKKVVASFSLLVFLTLTIALLKICFCVFLLSQNCSALNFMGVSSRYFLSNFYNLVRNMQSKKQFMNTLGIDAKICTVMWVGSFVPRLLPKFTKKLAVDSFFNFGS